MKNENKKTYCYDRDGTLCSKDCQYEDALPFEKVIDHLNDLYDKGNTIILFTSRGTVSGNNWRTLTETQLEKWGVKYHKLLMGKPHADIFIDDRAKNIDVWIQENNL